MDGYMDEWRWWGMEIQQERQREMGDVCEAVPSFLIEDYLQQKEILLFTKGLAKGFIEVLCSPARRIWVH